MTDRPDQTAIDETMRRHYGITDEEQADLDVWFTYHPPSTEQVPVYEAVRDAGYQMAETILSLVPPSPDRTVAVRRIREAVATANASLACYPEGKPR